MIKRLKKWWVLVVAIILVISLVCIYFFVFINKKKSDNSGEIPTYSFKSYVSDDEINSLPADQQVDQLLRKEQDLRASGKFADAEITLDKIAELKIDGYEMSYYSERVRLYKATNNDVKLSEFSSKLRQFLIDNQYINENDPLPDIDAGGNL